MSKGNRLAGLVIVLAAVTAVWAAPRYRIQVMKVYQNEGDTPLPIAVTCDHDSWVVLAALDTTRRSLAVQSITSASLGICISTITTTLYACTDTTPGPEVEPGGSFTDFSEAALRCRSRPSTSEVLKGMSYSDSGD